MADAPIGKAFVIAEIWNRIAAAIFLFPYVCSIDRVHHFIKKIFCAWNIFFEFKINISEFSQKEICAWQEYWFTFAIKNIIIDRISHPAIEISERDLIDDFC